MNPKQLQVFSLPFFTILDSPTHSMNQPTNRVHAMNTQGAHSAWHPVWIRQLTYM